MGMACSTHRTDEKLAYNLVGKNGAKRLTRRWEGNIKTNHKETGVKAWIGLIMAGCRKTGNNLRIP
jgi:hypothetical protein